MQSNYCLVFWAVPISSLCYALVASLEWILTVFYSSWESYVYNQVNLESHTYVGQEINEKVDKNIS